MKCIFLGPTPDLYNHTLRKASLVPQMVKNLPANVGDPRDTGSIFELGRSPRVGNGNQL